MESVYNEHRVKIIQIRDYIKTLKEIALVPSQFPEENSSQALLQFVSMPQKRSYDYNLIIITLYGIFESFIEDILGAYLNQLSKRIVLYSNLPDALKKNHIDLSAKLIANSSIKYESLTKESIIANLNTCLNQPESSYKLNIEAFTQHTSNFRIETIQEFFKMAGIDNIRNLIKKSSPIVNFLLDEDTGENEPKTLPDTKFFEILEDLVQRRNVIAHGSKVDELLSLDILDEYAKYVISLIESIYISVIDKYIEIMVSQNIAKQLGKPIMVFNNKIVCINNSNYYIKVGQVLIGKKDNNIHFWSRIESMQLCGNEITEIDAEKADDIGLGVTFKANVNYTYYLLSDE